MDRRQVVLEQVDVEQLIAADHPVRNIWNTLVKMDVNRFSGEIKSVEGHAGRNMWEPRLLIAIWVYAYSRGWSSARQIERECSYEPGLRWLTGLKTINHHTLSDFHIQHEAALQDLFTQVLGILAMEKLITLERVTVDGTKIRAAVNKKTFSRAHKISEHLKLARQHIEELQQQEREQGKRTQQVAARRRAARERGERLEQALLEIERLQREKKHDRDKPCQASTSDADAQFMRLSDHGLAPAYNVQIVTDARHKLIVDVEVSKQPSDAHHLLPALDRIQQSQGRYPSQAVADGDYTNHEAVAGAAERGVDYYGSWRQGPEEKMRRGIAQDYHPSAFHYDEQRNQMICPEGKLLALKTIRQGPGGLMTHMYTAQRADCLQCEKRLSCTPQNAMQKHGRAVSRRAEPAAVVSYKGKMETAEAKAIYKQRAPVAEFPHAWLKDKLKWRRLRCRGLLKAKAEALWACLTYNLQRYFNCAKCKQHKPAKPDGLQYQHRGALPPATKNLAFVAKLQTSRSCCQQQDGLHQNRLIHTFQSPRLPHLVGVARKSCRDGRLCTWFPFAELTAAKGLLRPTACNMLSTTSRNASPSSSGITVTVPNLLILISS